MPQGLLRRPWALALVSTLVTVAVLETGARLATLALYGRTTRGQVELRYFPFLETVGTKPYGAQNREEPGFAEFVRAPLKPKGERFVVVVIGASTARGLPGSLLASRLQEVYQREVDVTNLALPGHIVNQEVVMLGLFGLNLQPDLVITIDGANDPVTAIKTGHPGVTLPALGQAVAVRSPVRYALMSVARRSQFLTLLLKFQERRAEHEFATRRDLAEATAQQYLQGARALSVLARGAGARHVLLLQPYLHLRKEPTAEERSLEVAKHYEYRRGFMTDYMGRLAGRMRALPLADGTVFVDGTTAFDQSEETCFVDEVHLTDRGYELLIDRIVAAARAAGPDPALAADSGLWPLAPAPGTPTLQVDFLDF